MRKGYTHIAVVLDRSGSMASIKEDTIGGFNEFLKTQKEAEGTATLTLAQFDDKYEIVYNMVNVKDVPELTGRTFVPRGMTALNDAICKTIVTEGENLHRMKESSKPEKVIVVIITDGGENDSKEYTSAQVKEMVGHQTDKYNWEFVYIGANQDSFATAQSYNINVNNAMNYATTGASVGNVFRTLGVKSANLRSGVADSMAYTSQEREEQAEIDKA